jgi:hypothetical protein
LTAGVEHCPAPDYILGCAEGTPLSTRMVALTVRRAAGATDTHKTVTAMTLRHSFAVHALESGDSVRAVQEALGHACIDATLQYERCILPDIASPLAIIRQLQSRESRPPFSIPPPVVHNPRGDEADAPAPTAMLFLHPPSIDHLDLPFKDPESNCAPGRFSQLLRTHIVGRFLCHRRTTIRAG